MEELVNFLYFLFIFIQINFFFLMISFSNFIKLNNFSLNELNLISFLGLAKFYSPFI